MNDTKEYYLNSWQNAYNALNENQKLAVDTLEGPVMTIAGPGTGKTQLLAVRIGNILLQPDIQPYNILCLTFTDAGVKAMRDRLISFIGAEAYKVNIHTFHSFCNQVIKENPHHFGDMRDLQAISEIEKVELLHTLIDKLPNDHLFKKGKKNPYNNNNNLISLFELMKKEAWTTNLVKKEYDAFMQSVSDMSNIPQQYLYKNNGANYKKGDPKIHEIQKDIEKYTRFYEGCKLLDIYNKEMELRDRFDFQDMILWVIDRFRENDTLLGRYQERFQYILVDEYQDTNGSQNELLFLLNNYWDKPNFFIVGDDDQAIYRFQGANIGSIVEFANKYTPEKIVLSDNYRSGQKILDHAKMLIEYNNTRLVNQDPSLVKNLTEARTNLENEIAHTEILNFHTVTDEEVGIIQKIQELHDQGVAYPDIAIIYRNHKHADNLVSYFNLNKIPIQIQKKLDVLTEVEALKIIKILTYIYRESIKPHSAEDVLFEIMHYDYFYIKPLDVANFHLHVRKLNAASKAQGQDNDDRDTLHYKWRQLLHNTQELSQIDLHNRDTFIQFGTLIENWIQSALNDTVQMLIQKIITEGNILTHILKDTEMSWKLQVLNTFFEFVKTESASKRNYSLLDLLSTLEMMEKEKIGIPISHIINQSGGIHFMTAHGAKGLEFEHVFIIQCNSTNWEKKKGGNFGFSILPTLKYTNEEDTSETDKDEKIEDERRLFYVAMTRAKNYLYLTYHNVDDKDKPIAASQFITEIYSDHMTASEVMIPNEQKLRYKAELMKFSKGEASIIHHELVDLMLENFAMSVTNLNKYLQCPTRFYFETILKVPAGRNANMGFGSAVHYALEQYFLDFMRTELKSLPSVNKLKEYFIKGIEKYHSHFTPKEMEQYKLAGQHQLEGYHETHHKKWFTPKKYDVEYSLKNITHRGVELTGKLDRVDYMDDQVIVVDYKTGSYNYAKPKLNRPSERDILGGDYWRQIVFYRILLDADPKMTLTMREGFIDYIEEKDGIHNQSQITVTSDDIQIVSNQIVETDKNIRAKIFTPGCEEPDCQWCNFVKNNMPVVIEDEEEL